MVSKTTRAADTTNYVYNADGTLKSATKPAGESTSLVAALSQPPAYSGGQPVHGGTYTDAHGVVHNFRIDAIGNIQNDTYTADGVTYTESLVYAAPPAGSGGLVAIANEPYDRKNALLRVAYRTLNSVELDLGKEYDTLGRLLSETVGPAHSKGAKNSYTYDSNGFVASVFSGPSNVHQVITRDAAGHPLRVADLNGSSPTGREIDFSWGRPDAQPSTIVRHGVTYTLSYDDSATRNLSGVTDTLGRSAGFSYDSYGNMATASDGATTQSFAYDPNNRLVATADALANQTALGYTQVSCGCTEADEVTSIHSADLPAGKQWTLQYGPEGRLASVADPDGFIEAYGYEPTGELNSLIDRNGNSTTMTHDHLGRVQTMVDAIARAHKRVYSVPVAQFNGGVQNVSFWSGPTLVSGSASGTAASTDFSAALGNGDYQIGYNAYQPIGYPPQIEFYRDATFELANVLGWDDGQRLTQRRDRAGTPISSTALGNFSSNFLSESFGYNTSSSAPLVGAIEWPTPSGVSDENFTYNAELDTTGTIPSSGGSHVGYSYDLDAGGRLTTIHRRVPFIFGVFLTGHDRTFSYYPNGKLQQYSGPDGTKVYTYDARGLLKAITVTLAASTENWAFDYDAAGRSFHVTYPDGHVREQLYDSEGRVKSRCYKYSSASYCYTASYDGAGNATAMTDPYGGSDANQYDALNRLRQVSRQVNGSVEHVETYTYNGAGALKTTFDPVAKSSVTIDDQRPLLSGSGTGGAGVPNTWNGQPVTLDAGGRVTAFQGTTFTYAEMGRISDIQFANGSTTVHESYDYDAYFRRAGLSHQETTGGTTTTTNEFYLYEGANAVATLDQSNNLKDAYLFEGIDHPLRLARNGTSYFYELDLAGNVRRIRDASGADLGGYRYTAFGNAFPVDGTTPAAAIDQPLRWKGRWFQNVAGGVYDMRARWWSPQMGAFLSVDEFGYHDANSTLWGWGGQNPLKWKDPSGNCPQCILAAAGAIGGGLIAGGYYAFTAPTSLSWGQFASGAANAIAEGAIGGAAGALTAGFAAEAAPAVLPSLFGGGAVAAEQELENATESGALTSSEESAIASLQQRLEEHIQKLEDYLKNPDAYDNKGFLANAGNDAARRAQIINGRAAGLLNEIENYQSQINQLKDKACK
jgi:RHS repeat-associated protein